VEKRGGGSFHLSREKKKGSRFAKGKKSQKKVQVSLTGEGKRGKRRSNHLYQKSESGGKKRECVVEGGVGKGGGNNK